MTDGNEAKAAAPKRRRRGVKKLAIVASVVAVVIVAAAGMWVWHEQPGFCNAICHTSMDPYTESYFQEAGKPGVDKWGNEVSNTNAMLSIAHQKANITCLKCHVPSLPQQIGEVGETITGAYSVPLEEVNTEQLMVNSGHAKLTGDQFCLNESCHNMTRADLTELTSDMPFNPHAWQHAYNDCSDCHKSHRASVFMCTQCHTESASSVPDGWVSYAESERYEQAAAQ